MWKITTDNLVADADREGFSCIVDYHQLDASSFDKIVNKYVEPQKAALRDKKTSVNRRLNDDNLTSAERATANAKFERYNSALEQIALFEEELQELMKESPRDWSPTHQQSAQELKERVERFREETQNRLDILDQLANHAEIDMAELFTETFYATVQEQRGEWIDALHDLEEACEAYSRDATQPVEAHHYDLFDHFEDLIGSTHFASNGILFTTYYFNDGEVYLKDGSPRDGLQKDTELLAQLAVDLEEYISLAREINDGCQNLVAEMPSSWADRALSEVTTNGYRPNRKHGVVINITPLVDAGIVPKVVEGGVI